MHKPFFIIFAGCNGSGKSTYSKKLSNGIDVFDYDETFLNYYDGMRDSELREQIALNKTTEYLEELIDNAFEKIDSIAFETNFNNVPKEWIQRANSLDYQITIFFFVLDTLKKLKIGFLLGLKTTVILLMMKQLGLNGKKDIKTLIYILT